MKYIVLPVYDTDDPAGGPVYCFVEVKSYERDGLVFNGPFSNSVAAHEAAKRLGWRAPEIGA